MKGFAIFLVVLGHVYMFSYDRSESVLPSIIGSFHMPLFMFLSGLVSFSGITPPTGLASALQLSCCTCCCQCSSLALASH